MSELLNTRTDVAKSINNCRDDYEKQETVGFVNTQSSAAHNKNIYILSSAEAVNCGELTEQTVSEQL